MFHQGRHFLGPSARQILHPAPYHPRPEQEKGTKESAFDQEKVKRHEAIVKKRKYSDPAENMASMWAEAAMAQYEHSSAQSGAVFASSSSSSETPSPHKSRPTVLRKAAHTVEIDTPSGVLKRPASGTGNEHGVNAAAGGSSAKRLRKNSGSLDGIRDGNGKGRELGIVQLRC